MKRLLPMIAGLILVTTAACNAGSQGTTYPLTKLEPPSGAYFGINLDWGHDSAAGFNQRLGMPAAVYVGFFRFPFDDIQINNLNGLIEQVAGQKGLAMITLEPHNGLQPITADVADDLASRLSAYNRQGVPVFVRFAHEMNGSWYPWSQQPTAYIKAFRIIAEAVHKQAPLTAMLWAPNNGGGYPFSGGPYEALPGNTDFPLLDTDKDGKLTMNDDMYLPYYPGDDTVDWVGMSIYHWGNKYPWGKNNIPEEGKFIDHITGNYNGLNGDERAVPDYYHVYVEDHHKPMSITETAALYNPGTGGDSEILIKQAWWQQVFSPHIAKDFPGIKMINWFEWRKFEPETNSIIDWTVTFNHELVRTFSVDLTRSRLIFATALNKIQLTK